MSMTVIVHAVLIVDADRLASDPDFFAEFTRYRNPTVVSVSLEKSWHGLYYLLIGDAWESAGPTAFPIAGGREIPESDAGYGPAKLWWIEGRRSKRSLAAKFALLGVLHSSVCFCHTGDVSQHPFTSPRNSWGTTSPLASRGKVVTSSPTAFRLRDASVIGLLIAGSALGNFLGPGMVRGAQYGAGVLGIGAVVAVAGAIVGEFGLAAIWAALDPQRWAMRLPVALAVMAFLYAALMLGIIVFVPLFLRSHVWLDWDGIFLLPSFFLAA